MNPGNSKRLSTCWLRTAALLLYLLATTTQADFIVSHREPAGDTDKRDQYTIALIRLALEKTKATYGAYEMRPIPTSYYKLRARLAASNNQYPNILLEESYDDDFASKSKLDFIPFPIDLGILGYRVCFVSPQRRAEIAQAISVEELKKYRLGQGIGWQDAKILKHNGFNVIEVEAYESLFKMVAAGRIDLFCTGANQASSELQAHQKLTQLGLDNSFALVYKLPRFFFLHPDNHLLKRRITAGLKLAYNDGSMQRLWQENFGPGLSLVHLQTRTIFSLANPFITRLDPGYEQYLFSPLSTP
jgi:ABC-type amino acid transport substrate-binding protein